MTTAGDAVVLVVEKAGEEDVTKQEKKSSEGASRQDNKGSSSSSTASVAPPFFVDTKYKQESDSETRKEPPPFHVDTKYKEKSDSETLKEPVRTISKSAFSKTKSRFFEISHPVDENTVFMRSSQQSAPATTTPPRTPLRETPRSAPGGSVGEEEEDESYKSAIEKKKKITIRRFVEWVTFVLMMTCLVCSLIIPHLQSHSIWGLELWKWCLMVLVVFSGKLVTGWLVCLLVFLIEQNFMLRTKVLYFVYGMRKSVQFCLWMGLVLLSWTLFFGHSSSGLSRRHHLLLSYVSQALLAILLGSLFWMVKTLLMKMLASSFHVSTYFDRIQESVFHQYVLKVLSGPPEMELLEKVGASESCGKLSVKVEGKKGKDVDVIDVGKLQKLKQDKVSVRTMTRLANVIRNSGLSTISNTIDESISDGDGKNEGQINSESEAKAVAYWIFRNVAKPDSKYIESEDLLRFLSTEEVQKIFPQFAGAIEMGKIKKSAFRNWVVKAYLERHSLAHSLNDTKTAVKQLHNIANFLVMIVILIECLLVMGVATTKVLVFISSQLLLLGFMFGNTCKIIFESIIFVFVMHPFDVGDRCVIDGVQMTVDEMNILNTVFLRYDNERIYYPNAVLITKPISNFYRSPDMGDSIEFSIDVSTPTKTIVSLKDRIQIYLESKPQHWRPKHSVVVKEIENVNKMKIALYVTHTMNHQNVSEKNARRSDLIMEMKKIFEELDIKYHLLPQEVHLVTATSTLGRVF